MSSPPSAQDTQIGRFDDLEAALAEAKREMDAEAEEGQPKPLLRAMERRAQKAPARKRGADYSTRERPPEPSTGQVLLAFLRAARSRAGLNLRFLWTQITGTDTRTRDLRRALKGLGFTGIRVGKQISIRMDLLPLDTCLQLASLDDHKPPMELDRAMERIRAAAGAPLDEVYASIDPEPILSDTLQCIYQATLLSGERVAVRVRRNGVRSEVLATVNAMSLFSKLDELLGIVRPGFFDSVRAELLDFATEEFNFTRQARQQSVFQKRAADARMSWVKAPMVHHALCSDSVLVSGFEAGFRLSEIIDAVESEDTEFLHQLAEANIDPEVVARRLLRATWWALLENLFFIAQPEPSDVVVQPGNKLVFLTFLDCGTLSSPNKRLYGQLLRQLRRDDVSSAAQSIVQILSPLPYIDVFDFSKRIEAGLWYSLFALKDEHAPWWERTSISAWDTVLQSCRHYDVTPRLEVLRMIRATLLTEMMAAKLNPQLGLLDEFDRYSRRADKRAARAVMEDLRETDVEDLEARIVATTARVGEGLLRLGLFLETTAENLPVSHLSLAGKAAFVLSEFLRLSTLLATLAVVATVTRQAVALASGEGWDIGGALLTTLQAPLFLAAAFLLLSLTLRRVLFRLDDKTDD